MKKYYFKKNKGSIFLQVLLISFLLISTTLLIQLYLNSRFSLYKSNKENYEALIEINYLDEIIKEELKNIELKINSGEIKFAEEFFETNENEQKIYLESSVKHISIGGYKVLEENGKSLEERLASNYRETFKIIYIKNIKILDKEYLIRASILYKISSPRNLNNIYDATLKRMWIIENV